MTARRGELIPGNDYDEGIEIEFKKIMGTSYKVSVGFQGTAVLEIEADSPEEARLTAIEMTIDDLARKGQSDIYMLKIAAKEVIPASALSGQDEEAAEANASKKPRPSGWYRPR